MKTPIVSALFARCPTCGRTDRAYWDKDWYCLDPWHTDSQLLSRKEIVEYLRKENYEQEVVDIIDNFPPFDATLTGPVQTTFDEVGCKHSADCGWPECDCPRKPKVHSDEAVNYAFNKARELLVAAGFVETAAILGDCRPHPGPACRPIDTAPTDGTWVLIHEAFGVNSSKFSRFEVGRYHNGRWWDSKQFTIPNPTHWVPLPDEPVHGPVEQS